MTQAGTGRIILTGANTYTGLTTVQAGGAIELGINAEANVLANGADIQNSSVAGGATSVGALVFDYSGSDVALLNSILRRPVRADAEDPGLDEGYASRRRPYHPRLSRHRHVGHR